MAPPVELTAPKEPARAVPTKLVKMEKAPDLQDAKDVALLEAHRAGDETALAELLEGFQGRLFSVCLRMTNDREKAADMVQDAMVRIIKGIGAFDGRSKLSTWMIRVTINVCLTDRRRMRLRRTMSLDKPLGGGESSDSGRGTLGDSISGNVEREQGECVEMHEARRVLYEAMGSLDEHHRAMLILRDVQDLDYRQIGEILDVPEGTVKSRLFRARAALREQIERLGGSA